MDNAAARTSTDMENGTSATKSTHFKLRCGVWVAVILQGGNKSMTSAFTPSQDVSNKNQKCQDPFYQRRSSRVSLAPSNQNLMNSRDKQIREGNSVDNFAVRMAKYEQEETEKEYNDSSPQPHLRAGPNSEREDLDSEEVALQRRKFIKGLIGATAAGLAPAHAFERAYPQDLDFANGDSTRNLEYIRQERIAVQKSRTKQTKEDIIRKPFTLKNKNDFIGSAAWGAALWLLSGSRSNPLVRPLGNLLYDTNTNKGAWLKDRNEGLFTPFPAAFSLLMGAVFLILGVITDRALLLAAEGESTVVLQLAGVSLIAGASLELGRVASGEKQQSRDDSERDETLANEFDEFAERRLIVNQGGSCHRSEVTKAFRRYFAKYRVENDEYPLVDLEIERLLRSWNKRNGNPEDISSAGFLKNVKINTQAIVR